MLNPETTEFKQRIAAIINNFALREQYRNPAEPQTPPSDLDYLIYEVLRLRKYASFYSFGFDAVGKSLVLATPDLDTLRVIRANPEVLDMILSKVEIANRLIAEIPVEELPR